MLLQLSNILYSMFYNSPGKMYLVAGEYFVSWFFFLIFIQPGGNGGIEANEKASNNKQHNQADRIFLFFFPCIYTLPILWENINFVLKNVAMLPLERTNEAHTWWYENCVSPCYLNVHRCMGEMNSIWFFIWYLMKREPFWYKIGLRLYY